MQHISSWDHAASTTGETMLLRRLGARARLPMRTLTTLFAPSHEYVRIDGDIGTIGITDFAANQLGDIVYVELPPVGKSFSAGEPFASVVR